MALLWNFHPYGSRTKSNDPSRSSPFQDLNGFQYHDNWLHNLLIASSMNGQRPGIQWTTKSARTRNKRAREIGQLLSLGFGQDLSEVFSEANGLKRAYEFLPMRRLNLAS